MSNNIEELKAKALSAGLDMVERAVSGIPESTLAQEVDKVNHRVAAVERYRKTPEQLAGEIFNAFVSSVEAQLAEGEVTADERAAIVKVVDTTDLSIRDDVAEAILKLEAEEEIGKQMAKLRTEFAKSRGALARRLKWGLLVYLQERGIKKVTGDEHFFRVSKNPTRLCINEVLLPDEYRKPETKMVADKEKIERDLDAGLAVPGAHYEQLERLDVK